MRGYVTDPIPIINHMNEVYATTGRRPSNSSVAAKFDLSKQAVAKVVMTNGSLLRGEPNPAGRKESANAKLVGPALTAIRRFQLENGWAPSQRELAEMLGCQPDRVNSVIAKLAVDGLIEVGPHPRQIRIVGSVMKIPEVAL